MGTGGSGAAPSDRANDAEEIERLILRYAQAIDRGELDQVGLLFQYGRITADDGTTLAAGASAVEALYRSTTRLHADGTPRTAHVTTNVMVDVDPVAGTGTAESYFTVLQQTAEGPLAPIIAGRYHDRFARHDGAWRFEERRIEPRLVGDLSDHLLIDPSVVVGDPDPRASD